MSRNSKEAFLIVLVTAPSMEAGQSIARRLVDERLAACVNIVPGVTSIYRWKGQISQDSEVLLVCKTRQSCMEKLDARVHSLHPYEVPEILAIPLAGGSAAYLNWLAAETAEGRDEQDG